MERWVAHHLEDGIEVVGELFILVAGSAGLGRWLDRWLDGYHDPLPGEVFDRLIHWCCHDCYNVRESKCKEEALERKMCRTGACIAQQGAFAAVFKPLHRRRYSRRIAWIM